MDLTIKINLDNAALADDGSEYELRRVLTRCADRVSQHRLAEPGLIGSGAIMDINGNACGNWQLDAS